MNKKGFSLIELIIVVAILGILTAVAVPNYLNYLYKSRINTDISTARQFARSADMLRGTKGLDSIPENFTSDEMGVEKRPESGGEDGSYSIVIENDDIIVSFEAVRNKAGKYAGPYKVTAYGPLPSAVEGGMAE